MPYVRKGKCVHKQNADGSVGEQVGCSDTVAEAKAHLKALYANVPDASKEVDATPSNGYLHGPGGLESAPGQGGVTKKKKKKMKTPKEFAAKFGFTEKDFSYAGSETWVISSAAQALYFLLEVARTELYQLEASDSREIITLAKQLNQFISDQFDEMSDALNGVADGSDYYAAKESGGHGGYLVSDDSGDHLPTKKNGKLDHTLMGAAWAALHGGYRGNKYEGPHKSEAISKLKALYKSEGLTPPSDKDKEFKSTLQVAKEKEGGHYRWTLFTASAYQDRDLEIITEKALQRDCDSMELTGDYGELLWYHCDGELHAGEKEARPYIPLGKCDFAMVQNKIQIESGLFYDDAVGKIFTEKAAEFGASKAFWHLPEEPQDGIYYNYIQTKERSLLPRSKESNLLTRLFGQKEKAMADNKQREAALREKLGDEVTDSLMAQAAKMSKEADKFLASKAAKQPDSDEDEDDSTEDKPAPDMKKGKKAKEEGNDLVLALKEMGDKLEASIKDGRAAQEKAFADYTAKQGKELDAMKTNIATLQQTTAMLLGIQPGATFKASEKGKERTMSDAEKAAADKVNEAAGQGDNFLATWIMTGERPAA